MFRIIRGLNLPVWLKFWLEIRLRLVCANLLIRNLIEIEAKDASLEIVSQ